MNSPFRDYDSWLESPYTNRAREEEEFEKFCEANDLDFDDEDSWNKFEEWQGQLDYDGPTDPDEEREMKWEAEMERHHYDE